MEQPDAPQSPAAHGGAASAPRPADIAERAAATRVVVIGGGMAGLVAAWECAKVGMSVTVLEAREHPGGAVRRIEVGGLAVDAASDGFATMGGALRALVDELGLGDEVGFPAPVGPWVGGLPDGEPQPMPAGGLLGIPENPFQDGVRRVIGGRGAWRAYVDRLRPPLTIGHERSLGRLVATRMGDRVRDRLVAPQITGMYSVDVDDIDADMMAPGLNAALTRTGSLSGGVSQILGTMAEKPAGPPFAGLIGGNGRLLDALLDQLALLGARVRTATPVRGLERDGDLWRVVVDGPADPEDPSGAPGAAEPAESPAGTGDRTETIEADAVVVAVEERPARELLTGIVTGLGEAGPAAGIETVTLVLDAPALDAAPRGSGVLTVPGSRAASGIMEATVKWPWLAEAAAGKHVVRVTFGPESGAPATEDLDDEAAVALALSEASELLGVPLRESDLVDARRERFAHALPAVFLGAAKRRAAQRTAIAAVPGLAVVGAWLSGSGLVSVVPDARAEADRLRRALLWE